ncbi:response regulator [Ktedonosporobacter rubrisoli]|uniref:Response regulator n=1 Tax=Ktedonosporobacter rubrisoli TaxID=2509675 RepID=A0A4P6JJ28_KTERU|nr:response regulator [Ktedonosporobacter rubrisoli]QBD75088.1 response regulator [Ktedonosporobacter rubrisoli]
MDRYGQNVVGNEGQSKLILVIDDSATTRKIVAFCLACAGYQVVAFSDGYEALRWLLRTEEQLPALLFLDLVLPRMNGYQIAHFLKEHPRFAGITIVIIARRCGLVDKLKARLAGASAYLSKPLRTQDIIAHASGYLGPNASL